MKFLEHAERGRINSIDIVRGFSIMGILLVNGPTLNGSATKDMVNFAFQHSAGDMWYSQIIFVVAMGRFYPIFACLFGVTAAILMGEDRKIANVFLLWSRRIFFLLLIGVLHVILVWWGDILVVYSLLGFSLVLFYRKFADVIFKVFCWLLVLIMTLAIISALLPDYPKEPLVSNADLVYQQGSFVDISKQRVFDYFGAYLPGIFYKIDSQQIISYSIYFLELLLMFVLGFYLYRCGFLLSINNQRERAKKTFLVMLASTLMVALLAYTNVFMGDILFYFLGIVQGLFYGSMIIFLCHYSKIYRGLFLLAPVGKMSLSNYIFHTTSLSLLFYGYGFGLYGTIGPLEQAPILIGLMTLSIVFSAVWLNYFNYGPLEWLWRMAMYGKFFPLRRGQSVK